MNRIIIRDMFAELHAHKLRDLIVPGQIVAGWLLQGGDLEWLKKEYYNMASLFEDSPVIGWIREDVREQVLAEVQQQVQEERQRAEAERQRAEAERQRVLEQFRQIVVAQVTGHFPKLTRLAQKQVSQIEDKDRLQQLILRLSMPQNAETVENLLLDLDEDEQGAE